MDLVSYRAEEFDEEGLGRVRVFGVGGLKAGGQTYGLLLAAA